MTITNTFFNEKIEDMNEIIIIVDAKVNTKVNVNININHYGAFY